MRVCMCASLTLTLTAGPGVDWGSCLRDMGGVETPRGLPSVCALVLCSGTGGGESFTYLTIIIIIIIIMYMYMYM